MRRTPLVRRTPLRNHVTLVWVTRARPAVPSAVKAALAERSAGWCEAQLPGCDGRATDACHRKARKAGGRPLADNDHLANLWHGCRICHAWQEGNPTAAGDLGLSLEEHQDPREEPMAYRNRGWVLLDDGGGIVEAYPGGEP